MAKVAISETSSLPARQQQPNYTEEGPQLPLYSSRLCKKHTALTISDSPWIHQRNLVRCLPQTWRNLRRGALKSARLEQKLCRMAGRWGPRRQPARDARPSAHGENEHLPGLRSQGPHSVLGFISRNHQVLTRERKERKRNHLSPWPQALSVLQNKGLCCGEKTSPSQEVGRPLPLPTLAPGLLVSPKEGKGGEEVLVKVTTWETQATKRLKFNRTIKCFPSPRPLLRALA